MTTFEFEQEFNIQYNNIMSNIAPGLDSYEISVFLTRAQSEILKNYFNPKGNKYVEGFDDSRKRQIDFSSITTVMSPAPYDGFGYIPFDDRSSMYLIPNTVLFVLNETANKFSNGISLLINIVPISYEEYSRNISKPYKLPFRNQGWRLSQVAEDNQKVFEIITGESGQLSNYKIRYVRKPNPIIIRDLYDGLTIDGVSVRTECELDSILHQEIIQRAVELAKASFTGDLNTTVEIGKRSE